MLNHSMWECGEHHSWPNASGEMYCFSRNVPHPRMVFLMPGLNNAPVCVVTSCFSRERPLAGNAGTPEQKHEREHTLQGITTRKLPAHLPELRAKGARHCPVHDTLLGALSCCVRQLQEETLRY